MLDIFILKKFLGTYFMATILILAVISMFDITEKLDAFLTAPLKETLLTISPLSSHTFANMLSPLFVFISVIFFTTKLAGNSEIIAILSSGVSFKKIAEAIYDRGGYNSSHDLSFKQLHNSAPQCETNSIHK